MKQLCRNAPSLFVFTLLVFAFAQPTRATTAIMLSDTELIVHSRLIVTGRVVRVSCDSDLSGMIWTYVEIGTDRVLKGELRERTIVLKQLGGTIGGSGVRVAGQAEFAQGERVLLYLNSGSDGSLHAAHGFMGKFSIVEDSAGVEFVERFIKTNEIQLLARWGSGEVTDRAPFEAYVAKVEGTLRQEAALVAEIDTARLGEPLVPVPAEYSRKKKQSGDLKIEFAFFSGPVRWMEADAGQAVRYLLNPNGSPVSGGGSAEIGRAMSAWSQSGAAIQLQVSGQTGSCGISFDNTNTISFGDCMNQLDPPVGGCAGVVALTAVGWTQETRLIGGTTFSRLFEADTVFNDGMNCFLGNSANLAEVACHELGHSIGLGHSTDPTALMRPQAHGGGRDANLGADDRAGVLAIYPATAGGGGGGPGPGTGSPVSIATLSVNEAVVNRSYTMTLAASGGAPPYRWALVGGALPSGLFFSINGIISGVPNFAGSSTFAVQVLDSASPTRVDARWFSLTVRENGGSIPGLPIITGAKVKGLKKLWIFGQNFRADSLIVINGIAFTPVQFAEEGAVDQLLAKGKLRLRPPGTNAVTVINPGHSSAPFLF